jgi:hypothetical protein
LLLKHIVRLKEGDWRDWNAIRAWAGGLYVHLTTAGQHASSAA